MTIPNAFAEATPVELHLDEMHMDAAATEDAEAQPWKEAPCPLVEQEQTEWCWASVGQGVRKRYQEPPFLRQCDVANTVKSDCCSPGACNTGDSLSIVLKELKHRRGLEIGRALKFSEVYEQIADNRPVCCFIDHNAPKVDHFVVIAAAGVVDGEETVGIVDPGEGREHEIPQPFAYTDFLGYDGGEWLASYKTKKMSEA
jgi:hypothetical protein